MEDCPLKSMPLLLTGMTANDATPRAPAPASKSLRFIGFLDGKTTT
jgi:hypothetical protein